MTPTLSAPARAVSRHATASVMSPDALLAYADRKADRATEHKVGGDREYHRLVYREQIVRNEYARLYAAFRQVAGLADADDESEAMA